MFRWLEKKSYALRINQRLARDNCAAFYPRKVVAEIVDASLSETEKIARVQHACGFSFSNDEFLALFDRTAAPSVKVLVANALFDGALRRGALSEALEMFERHFGNDWASRAGVDAIDVQAVQAILTKHGCPCHISTISPILFSP